MRARCSRQCLSPSTRRRRASSSSANKASGCMRTPFHAAVRSRPAPSGGGAVGGSAPGIRFRPARTKRPLPARNPVEQRTQVQYASFIHVDLAFGREPVVVAPDLMRTEFCCLFFETRNFSPSGQATTTLAGSSRAARPPAPGSRAAGRAATRHARVRPVPVRCMRRPAGAGLAWRSGRGGLGAYAIEVGEHPLAPCRAIIGTLSGQRAHQYLMVMPCW